MTFVRLLEQEGLQKKLSFMFHVLLDFCSGKAKNQTGWGS